MMHREGRRSAGKVEMALFRGLRRRRMERLQTAPGDRLAHSPTTGQAEQSAGKGSRQA